MTDTGVPDGIKVDTWGNVWTGMGDGVACYSPGAPMSQPPARAQRFNSSGSLGVLCAAAAA